MNNMYGKIYSAFMDGKCRSVKTFLAEPSLLKFTFSLPVVFTHKFRPVVVAALFLLLSLSSVSQALPDSRDYKVKALFLFNFARFVVWPKDAFSAPDSPLIIGVLGVDPFGDALNQIVKDENVKGRPIVVEQFSDPDEINHCHILFISKSEAERLNEIINQLPPRNILTVSDIPDFETNGGIIGLKKASNNVKLRINLSASKEANLEISSKLLQVAQIVR